MANLLFSKKHNMVANLDTNHENAQDYREIVTFLRHSEIFKAISADPEIFESHIRDFWNTTEARYINGGRSIVATVTNTRLEINLAFIRHVLGFLDRGTTAYIEEELRQVYRRMGCEGDVTNLKLVKKNGSYQWRYLWHVVIHYLAGRKEGWDSLNI